jgi:hypothetical protein
MLKQETIQKIEKLLKITGLAEAIKDEAETDITIDDKLSIFSEEEVTTLKSNSYKEGKKAGVEMEVDDIKKELGLEFTGKTVKGLITAHKEHVIKEANITPNEKVKELETKLQTVQKTVQDQEKLLADKDNEVVSTKVNTELYKHIPAPKEDGPAFDQDDIIYKMRREGYDFKLEGGKVIPYKDGNKLTDKLSNDLPVKDVVSTFLKEKKLIASDTPITGGRGGGDKRPAGKPGSVTDIKKEFEAQGKSTLGSEFNAAVQEAAKDPDFKME